MVLFMLEGDFVIEGLVFVVCVVVGFGVYVV